MASVYHFTPRQVMDMTMKQINAFGHAVEAREKGQEFDRERKEVLADKRERLNQHFGR